jgi:excisionase family DNA binding protein
MRQRANPRFDSGITAWSYWPGFSTITPAGNSGRYSQKRICETSATTSVATDPSDDPMAASFTSTATLPHGLPPWLVAFVDEALRENQTLAENGAGQAVTAREALLQKLIMAAQQYLDGEITVEEAASILGRHPETIRRAVRKGALPDGRSKPRGRHRIRRGDLESLAGYRTGAYDPIADAQDIAKRRRPL